MIKTRSHAFRQWLSITLLMLAFKVMPAMYKRMFAGYLMRFRDDIEDMAKGDMV